MVIAALMAGGVYLLYAAGTPAAPETRPVPRRTTPSVRTAPVRDAPAPKTAQEVEASQLPAISPQAAYRRWRSDPKHAILLDVRTQEEYDKWNIPGALHVPIAEKNFGALVEAKIPDRNADIFLFCRSGRRTEPAAEILRARGYKKLYNLGGIIDWPYETAGYDS